MMMVWADEKIRKVCARNEREKKERFEPDCYFSFESKYNPNRSGDFSSESIPFEI